MRTLALFVAMLGIALLTPARFARAHGDDAHTLRFVNGLWYDGTGFVRRDVVTEDREIRTRAARAVEDTIDLAGGYVVPAFGDAHSHVFSDTTRLEADLRRFLAAGILFSKNPNNPASRVAAVRARLNRPTTVDVVFANGGLTSPGGHPAQIYEDGAAGGRRYADDAYVEVADDAALDAKWPRVLAGHPDFLKVYLESSEEHARRRDDPAFFGRRGLDPALLPAVVRRAHAARLTVSAHVTSAADFHAATAAGVDEITHLPLAPITAEDAREVARRGVTVVTTSVSHRPAPSGVDLDALHRRNVGILRDAGVRLALGTDHPALTVIDEAENLRRIGALDAAALLRLLCVETPRTIFPGRRLGSLEPGSEASFVVLEADPLRDFSAVRRVALRVKQGVVLRIAPAKPGLAEAMAPMLMRGDLGGALAFEARLRAARSDSLDLGEPQLNGLGYALLQHGQAAAAVAIFGRNAEAFPDSPNAWDSLADGHLAAGDSAAARADYRRVLASLERRPPAREEIRRKLEERARTALEGR